MPIERGVVWIRLEGDLDESCFFSRPLYHIPVHKQKVAPVVHP